MAGGAATSPLMGTRPGARGISRDISRWGMGWELPGGVSGNCRGSVVCRWAVGGCRSSCTLRLGLCLAGEPPSR